MEPRERLIEATIACLQELGYARTTTRAIVARAELHVPAVNYYFGSKSALVRVAILEALRRWAATTIEMPIDPEADAAAQLVGRLTRFLETLESDRRYVVAAVEAFAQAERDDDLRAELAAAYEQLRRAIVAMLPDSDAPGTRAVSSVLMALLDGLAIQNLLDPATTPPADEVARSIVAIARIAQPGGS